VLQKQKKRKGNLTHQIIRRQILTTKR